jgi:phage repressor protein C with HTH and peptisase S24 domain
MNEHFNDMLDRIMKATGAKTQVELAKVLDIRQSSISDAKRRKSVPAEWLLKLYRSRGLNPDWIVDGQGEVYLKPDMEGAFALPEVNEPQAAYQRSPARGRVVNVSSMAGKMNGDGQWRPEFIEQLSLAEIYHAPNLLVVKVDGSAMEPIMRRGSYVGIDTDQKRVLSGEIYALTLPEEGLALRRVFWDADAGVFRLRAENPAHPERLLPAGQEKAVILGRCIWVIQSL